MQRNNNWFSKKEKTKATTVLLAGSYFGSVVAPFASVYSMQHYGWHSVFYVFGAIGLVICAVFFAVISSYPEDNRLISQSAPRFIQQERFK